MLLSIAITVHYWRDKSWPSHCWYLQRPAVCHYTKSKLGNVKYYLLIEPEPNELASGMNSNLFHLANSMIPRNSAMEPPVLPYVAQRNAACNTKRDVNTTCSQGQHSAKRLTLTQYWVYMEYHSWLTWLSSYPFFMFMPKTPPAQVRQIQIALLDESTGWTPFANITRFADIPNTTRAHLSLPQRQTWWTRR